MLKVAVGHGIDPNSLGAIAEALEHLQTRIFESQFMTKSTERGTDLGLSIAHQIITDTHQGDSTCQSILENGSIFRIALPV